MGGIAELGGDGMSRMWHIGTRYHAMDTYREIIDRGTVRVRLYPATDDGTENGNPIFLSREALAEKRRNMGPYVFGAQMLQNPTADKAQGFREEWLKYWPAEHYSSLNRYILVDPASKKKDTSDYTVFMVVGLGADRNYYIAKIIRDRMNLTERARTLFALHKKFRPLGVGYEEYGLQADIEHIEYEQEQKNYRFDITPLGGKVKKEDRIKRLVPHFEQGRVYLIEDDIHTDYQGVAQNMSRVFVREEYLDFPLCGHDDMLDCLARIEDMPVEWPLEQEATEKPAWMQNIAGGGLGSWKTR